jgi:putative FmdB family regulatory protein
MPIYEYVADHCGQHPACSKKKEYLHSIRELPLTSCRECGVPIRRIMSTFAAQSGEFGVSSPDPTPLNVTGIRPPRHMPSDSEGGCDGSHDH